MIEVQIKDDLDEIVISHSPMTEEELKDVVNVQSAISRVFTGGFSGAPTHRPLWTFAVRRAIKVGVVIVKKKKTRISINEHAESAER